MSSNLESIELKNLAYLPVTRENATYYGGSQMWFPTVDTKHRDYIINNNGCGTIAVGDLLLYLAIQNQKYRTSETEKVIKDSKAIDYNDYLNYIRRIDKKYTHTKRLLAVLGPKAASAINKYSRKYHLGITAVWKCDLSNTQMYECMKEMLRSDIPVILAIGPNIPNIWGKKGISFYKTSETVIHTEDNLEKNEITYLEVIQHMNSHYVTVTGIVKDITKNTTMLKISSWGKQYFINYDEYREYVKSSSAAFTSSILSITL